jgi:hypothetical protein
MNPKKNPALAATNKPGDTMLLNAIQNTPEGQAWKCPCCNRELSFQSWEWLDELQCLVARHNGTGIHADIHGMTLSEKWGALLFLRKQEKK